jgi:iron complex outermembrane receptor protein
MRLNSKTEPILNKALAEAKLALIFALSLIWLSAAWAGEVDQKEKNDAEAYKLNEIVVTAEKIKQNIQDVPMSISALSAAQIEDAGITSITDVSDEIPNLYIVNWGSRRDAFVYIRGFGSSRQQDSAVGLYVDDVPLINVGTFLTELNEIERIEVLRGPQGTLYGRNTLAGVINIVTKKPTDNREGSASAAFGDYAHRDYRLSYRGAIVQDKLFVGVSAVKSTRDGYAKDDLLGGTANDQDSSSGRFHLRWMPTDRLDVLFSADAEVDRDGAIPLTDLAQLRQTPNHVSYNSEGYQNSNIYGPSIRVNYEGKKVSLTSITGLRRWDEDSAMDQDFSPADILFSNWSEKQTQLTQEVRLTSLENAASLKWLLGAFYFHDDFDDDILVKYGSDAAAYFRNPIPDGYQNHKLSTFKNKGYALFGSTTYTVTNRLDLTAGLRWDHENKELDNEGYDFFGAIVPGSKYSFSHEENFDELIPKLAIGYHIYPDLMTYASVTNGYKSGGFNNVSDPTKATYDPEHSWNYEIGMKSSWLDRILNANLAAFFSQWNDQQIVQFLPPSNTIIQNAGKSHNMGFEAEISSRPLRGLQLTAGFGYVDALFDKYDDPALGISYDNNKIPVAPKYNLNLAAQYKYRVNEKISLFANTGLRGVGGFYWDDANTLEENAYELVNIHIGIESEYWRVTLWAKNILDKEYAAIALQVPGFPAWGQSCEPRTFGIEAKARF